MRIPRHHRRTSALCSELGLRLVPFANGSSGTRGVDGSGSFADFGGYAAWERAEDVWSRWEQTVQDVRRDWVRLSRRQFADRWDRYSIRDFLRSRGCPKLLSRSTASSPSRSPPSVLPSCRSSARPFSSAYDDAVRIDGGMDLLPRELAKSLGDGGPPGHEVERIVDGPDCVEVTARSPGGRAVFRADLVVCTCRSPFSALSTWSGRSVRANDGRSDSCTTTPRRRSTSSSGDRRGVGRSGQLVVRSSTAAPIRRTHYYPPCRTCVWIATCCSRATRGVRTRCSGQRFRRTPDSDSRCETSSGTTEESDPRSRSGVPRVVRRPVRDGGVRARRAGPDP